MTALPPPLALTMGDPAGIGGEIALKAWLRRDEGDGVPPFVALDDPARLEAVARTLGITVPVRPVAEPEDAPAVFAEALPVLPHPLPVAATPGRPDPANGPAVIASIDAAVRLSQAGRTAAVVTNPINKKVLYDAGFRFPGHTEYLAHLAGDGLPEGAPVMMLACDDLRVVPVTIHIPLAEVPKRLTTAAIVAQGRILAEALKRDFAVAKPRLAVAGLNPHAGEDGSMGREDIEIVAPAVAALRVEGIDARGPLPADTMFHAAARATYDAALGMYHDQVLIPIKTLDFAGGVNVTLGLPFVRTSPDHGTAYGIAGKGLADPSSLINALRMAASMAEARARA